MAIFCTENDVFPLFGSDKSTSSAAFFTIKSPAQQRVFAVARGRYAVLCLSICRFVPFDLPSCALRFAVLRPSIFRLAPFDFPFP
jgi:hypothetical protein